MSWRIDCGSVEFALARILARHGQRIDEVAWKRIEVVRGLAQALELARGTALRPWLVGITADSNPAQIETVLRGHAQALVDELAAWLPVAWQPALDWCALLPDLAALQHLARGGKAPAWLPDDDARWAALAAARTEPDRIGAIWLEEFQRRLPPEARPADGMVVGTVVCPIARLIRLLQEHVAAFARSVAAQGWPQRAALRARLVLQLRSAGIDPAVAFIHLALCALDLERLRAELLRRACFPRWAVA